MFFFSIKILFGQFRSVKPFQNHKNVFLLNESLFRSVEALKTFEALLGQLWSLKAFQKREDVFLLIETIFLLVLTF